MCRALLCDALPLPSTMGVSVLVSLTKYVYAHVCMCGDLLLQNGSLLTKIPSKHRWEASADLNQRCWASKYTALHECGL